MDQSHIESIERVLEHTFRDHQLLERAVTHASLVDSRLQSNERLEFLGDAVLGLVVCGYLFEQYPDLLEGEMTKIKSTVVSRKVCAEVALSLGLADLLRMGKGMNRNHALPGSVLAAVLESLVGALYLDGGLEVAQRFILRMMKPLIENAARSGHQSNFKSVLQQTSQQTLGLTPQYIVMDEKGPDHAKCFEVAVEIGARRFGSCWGPSKKQAEQDAALAALTELGHVELGPDGLIHLRAQDGADTDSVAASHSAEIISPS